MKNGQAAMSQPPPSVPSPDPTLLTTEALRRSIQSLTDMMEVRLAALDKATELAAARVERIPAEVAREREALRVDISHSAVSLRELLESKIALVSDVGMEKFAAIDGRFRDRDARIELAAQESRISLDAALSAQKEAVSEQNNGNAKAIDKSEDATQKRIDSLVQLMGTTNKSLEDKISESIRRLDRSEGTMGGGRMQRADANTTMSQALSVLSVLIAAGSVVFTIVGRR